VEELFIFYDFQQTCKLCFQTIQYNSEHVCFDMTASLQQQYVDMPLTIIQDIESFIETVEQTRILWDHTIPYANREAVSVKKAWADIDKMFSKFCYVI